MHIRSIWLGDYNAPRPYHRSLNYLLYIFNSHLFLFCYYLKELIFLGDYYNYCGQCDYDISIIIFESVSTLVECAHENWVAQLMKVGVPVGTAPGFGWEPRGILLIIK